MLRFLSTALYKGDDGTPTDLEGALVTSFDPTSIYSRAGLSFLSADELKAAVSAGEAMGFAIGEDGVLLSDTASLLVTDASTCDYVSKEADSTDERQCGLIDVLLHLSCLDAHIIPNWDDYLVHGANPVHIPISSFRVSNSSFNIYAPYRGTDGAFRTCSLVDVQTNKSKMFAVAVPQTIGFTSWLAQAIRPTGVADGEYNYYMVDATLDAASALFGEAFCNYLAFQVSYYRLGLKIIDWFRDTYKLSPPDITTSEVKAATTDRKVPAPSMTIEAPYKKHAASDMMKLIMSGQHDTIQRVCERDEEAYITYSWLTAILKAAQVNDGDDAAKLRTACFGLKAKAKQMLLHFELELLSQRLHIMSLGMAGDILSTVLKGGGVRGYSCKRFYY